jgi:hypothetical protein
MMVLAFTFNMMVLNFPVCFDFFTEAIVGLYILVLFLGAAFVTGYYILNLRFYCRRLL